MTEKDIRHAIIKLGVQGGFRFYPIETHGTVPGFADLVWAGGGFGGVIELKITTGVRKIRIPYRPGQRPFLKLHAMANPRTYVLAWHDGTFFLICPAGGFPEQYDRVGALYLDSIWEGPQLTTELLRALVDGPGLWSYNRKQEKIDQ